MKRFHFQKYKPMYSSCKDCRTISKSNISSGNVMWIILCVIFMFFWSAFNNDNADYIIGYSNRYYDLGSRQFELGYRVLTHLGNYLGLSFFSFRFLFVTVTLFLTIRAICKYSKKPVFVMFLFMLYPFLGTIVQIRNAFAASIVMNGIGYLKEDTLKGKIKYIIIVLLASLFHKICLFYLLLVIVNRFSSGKIVRISILMFVLLYVTICCYANEILQIASQITGDARILYYLDNGGQHYFVKSMLPYIVIWILLLYLYWSRIRHRECTIDQNDVQLYKSGVLLMGLLPLFVIDGNYFRIWAYVLPLFYAVMVNLSFYKSHVKRDTYFVAMACIFVAAGLSVIELGPYDMNAFNNVTKAVFSNNAILDWVKAF